MGKQWSNLFRVRRNSQYLIEILELYVGELQPEDLHKVCFQNERYKRITISDIEQTTNLLNILQGPSVEPRKQYIYENATRLGFNFD